jgi:hypothetical protein
MVVTHNDIVNAIALAQDVAYLNAQARAIVLGNGEIPCAADNAKAIEIESWIDILERAEINVLNDCLDDDLVWQLIQNINEQYRDVNCDVSRTYSRNSSSGGGSNVPTGYVERVLGVNVDNSNPSRPVIRIYVDGVTITGNGTEADPFVAVGGSGSGTVNSGTQYRLAYYAATGTAVSQANAITANRALISDANGVPTHSSITATILSYLSNVTSDIQTQINSKQTSLGFTPENVVNKVGTVSASSTNYPTNNAVISYVTGLLAGYGNTNTVYLNKAALIALEGAGALVLTTRYRVTNATPYVMEVVPETVSKLGQSATVIDDVYSGQGNWNPTTDTFVGTIYDADGNTWNGCLPSGTTLGSGSSANIFLSSGTNVFGASARRNIIKQDVTGFIVGANFQNTTIEAGVTGANYTASPDYDFLYGGEACRIIYDGINNYHLVDDPANNRIVCTLMVTPFTVSYIGGSGAGTNLGNTPSPTQIALTSSTGTGTNLPLADATNAGLLKPSKFTVLENTSGTNTGDNATNSQYSGLATSKADVASPTFTGTVTTPAIIVSSETASRVAIFDASKNIKSADTATYPSLTELSYGKGVTSAIQTQLDAKASKTFVENISLQDNGTSIAATTYTIELYAAYAYTINELKIIADAGTCTAALKINGTNVTGISSVSVSTTIATGTASAANTVAVGDKITLVTTSNSGLNNLQLSIKTTRI